MSDDKNRQSLLLPVLIPLVALAAIGLVLFGFSRVLLQITPTAAWVVALIAAAGIVTVAAYVAGRKAVGGGSLLSMVGAVAGIAMLSGGVALFASEKGEGGEGPELPQVLIVAPIGAAESGFAQDTREVTAPAGEVFDLVFDNQDSQQPHNVVIAVSDEPDAEQLFREEPYTGPEKRTWPVEPPLEEGSYFFFCEVHPTTMTGSLEAVPGGGGEATTVVAEGSMFNTDQITLPADTAATIILQNRDASIQHNLSIYRDEGYTDPIVMEAPFSGPGEQPYDVPALEAATYFFRCDIHPTTMEGTVVVEGGGGATGATGPGEQPAEPTGGG